MAEIFKLPVSSYDELLKIFQAYASPKKEGVELSLDEISQTTGMSRTIVSKNNGFMVQTGLITEGNKKAATDIGRALGRAYGSKVYDEVERIWKQIVADVEFLNRMVSAVRIRNGMDRNSFINHIVYSSGLKDGKGTRCGAGAIIEILKSVKILDEVDGKIIVIESENPTAISDATENVSSEPSAPNRGGIQGQEVISAPIKSGVVINININCTTNELDTLGEKLKSLLQQISE